MTIMLKRILIIIATGLAPLAPRLAAQAAAPREIVVDCRKPLGDAAAISDFLGAGGALEAVMSDPKNPIVKAWLDLGFRHFYLETIDGKSERQPLVEPTRGPDGKLVIDFTEFDKRVQQIVRNLKARPHVYLGHVPRVLSSRPDDPSYMVYAPKSLREWSDYVGEIVSRLVLKHGLKGLYYHCLGEPDHSDSWKASAAVDAQQLLKEHVTFYGATYAGIKAADPSARVGGPATMNWQRTKWTQEVPFELRDWIAALARYNAALPAERRAGLDFIAWQDYAWSSEQLSDGAQAVSKMLAEHGFDANTPKVLGGSGWGSWSSDYIAEEPKPHHRASHLIHNIIREFKDPRKRLFSRAFYYSFFYDDANTQSVEQHSDLTQVRRVSLVRTRWDEKQPFLTPLYAAFQMAAAMRSGKIVATSAPAPLEVMAVHTKDGSVVATANNHTSESVSAVAVFQGLPFETPKLNCAITRIDEAAADYGRGLQEQVWEMDVEIKGGSVQVPLILPAYGSAQVTLWPAYPQ
jgi:hypothetical protein